MFLMNEFTTLKTLGRQLARMGDDMNVMRRRGEVEFYPWCASFS